MIDYKNLGQHLIEFVYSMTLSLTAETEKFVAVAPFSGWIRNIYAKVCTTASGTFIHTWDININAVSIYSATTTQLSLTGTNSTVDYGTLGTDPPPVTAGDIISVDNDGAEGELAKGLYIGILLDKQNPGACSNVADLSSLR